MSTRSRSRLFPFALAVVVAGIAPGPASAIVDESRRDPNAVTATPTPTRVERAVKLALDAVGTPYRWGGESPSTGFDCSGLVRWAYGRVGVDLPHNSNALYSEGRRVPEPSMEPGDILFFEGLGTSACTSVADGWCTRRRPGEPSRSSVSRRRTTARGSSARAASPPDATVGV